MNIKKRKADLLRHHFQSASANLLFHENILLKIAILIEICYCIENNEETRKSFVSFIVITFILGIIIGACGVLLWKKERIEMLKPRLHRNVTDVQGYTAAFGKTLLFMGTLLVVSGIMALLSFIPPWLSSLIFYAGIIASIAMLLVVQHKYNGTFLSK